ncbi:ras-related GTP-binding protein D-like isoform X2 [Symsagittifera roscoffensis]|uniref:ras-related GTP-binding protein D-like isoform X2 n=1 Tax=Symsagittifera roscoffensis TaxID=84072 RepID=UPI00307B5595
MRNVQQEDDYADSLDIMRAVVTRAYSVNPNINFEIFIHKVDGLNDDHKIEIQRDIYHRAYDKLNQDDQSNITLSFSLTSIYDHSIFEAFSKVVQKLIPQLATLEHMLSIFVENSGIDKAFLFDVVSKIYIATDASAVDMQTYELCCDMIDVVIDLSGIYSNDAILDGLEGDSGSVNSGMFDSSTPPNSNGVAMGSSVPNGSPNMGMVQANDKAANGILLDEGGSYDYQSSSVIKLTNGSVMVLKEVNRYLALVFIMRDDHYNQKAPLVDYNFFCFRGGIQKVFKATNQAALKRRNQQKQKSENLSSRQQSPRKIPSPGTSPLPIDNNAYIN